MNNEKHTSPNTADVLSEMFEDGRTGTVSSTAADRIRKEQGEKQAVRSNTMVSLVNRTLRSIVIVCVFGLVWGVLNQFLPALLDQLPASAIYRDELISLLWVVLLVVMLVSLGPGKYFLYHAVIGAAFWLSSTTAYFLYYLATLAQSSEPNGTFWTGLPDGGISFLWNFVKHTLLAWLLISGLGGFLIGIFTQLILSRLSKNGAPHPNPGEEGRVLGE